MIIHLPTRGTGFCRRQGPPADDGATNQAGIWASKAEKFQLVIVDIFGSCLPRIHAGEEYLSKFAGFSSPRLFLLYEFPVKQLFKQWDT